MHYDQSDSTNTQKIDALTFPVVQKCIPHISHLLLRNLVQERVGDDVGSIFSRDKASDQRDNLVLFKKYEARTVVQFVMPQSCGFSQHHRRERL